MSHNNFPSTGTSGFRITRRSARNWANLATREASTPTSSYNTRGEFEKSLKKLHFIPTEFAELANKYLSIDVDEAGVKKLTTKREEGFFLFIFVNQKF